MTVLLGSCCGAGLRAWSFYRSLVHGVLLGIDGWCGVVGDVLEGGLVGVAVSASTGLSC
jgi:hypothetical protein